MQFKNSEGKGSFQTPPAGPSVAVCVKIIDLGTQETTYGAKRQCVIFWELDEKMDDGRPFLVNKYYTASLGTAEKPSKLREDLQAWRGKAFSKEEEKGFEAKNLLGKCCTINMVLNKDGSKTVVGAITPLMKNLPPIKPSVEPVIISLDDSFDKKAFDELSDFWRTKILETPEYAELFHKQNAVEEQSEVTEDEIPF